MPTATAAPSVAAAPMAAAEARSGVKATSANASAATRIVMSFFILSVLLNGSDRRPACRSA
ncbi:MAG TPA: hypothetical protein VMS10_04045 [Methyloceanibacter sp.]|nr:hypothetical protein [Methyloceanibacter sp.]